MVGIKIGGQLEAVTDSCVALEYDTTDVKLYVWRLVGLKMRRVPLGNSGCMPFIRRAVSMLSCFLVGWLLFLVH